MAALTHNQFGTTCFFGGDLPVVGTRAEVDRVTINQGTSDPISVLIEALRRENRIVDGRPIPIVVELCDVELDLTGQHSVLDSNRALIASPDCARGPRKRGPRIYITDNRTQSQPFLEISGDNVVISGFRLEGPTTGIAQGDDYKERGIYIKPTASIEPIRHILISNMEIFHWSGQAIDVRDNTELVERGRLFNTNEGAVRIRDNYIHHNRHGDGYGYGVEVAAGAYALIEQNVFDENRHAIAGGSWDRKKDFSGYTLRDNLILPGGGVHCSEHWANALLGWQSTAGSLIRSTCMATSPH
jgi:hypothetical protein